MALTNADMKGQPDKHIVGSKSGGPAVTGNYSDTNASGEVPDASSSPADSSAKAIYGSPPSGTRMPRIAGEAQEALSASPNGISGCDNANEAFIDGSTKSGFTSTSGGDGDDSGGFGPNSLNYPSAASIGGDPGFPGLSGPYGTP
jgi:hypothetical protein